MSTSRIPLFPLSIVLFPGQVLPLHIFENRYRMMTRYCIETNSPFGIVYVHEGDLAQIGCSAMIVKTLKEYEDGRSDILTAGQQAFRLVRTYEDMPYYEGDIEYLEEELAGADPVVSAQLEHLFNQCHHVLYEESAPPLKALGNVSLAYHVASELPIETVFRQSLLELRSETERQIRLVARLTEWYPQLQNRNRVRGRARGNGHGAL